MRTRISVSLVAAGAVVLALGIGVYVAYSKGMFLELRESGNSEVSAPLAGSDLPIQSVKSTVFMTPQQYLPGAVRLKRGDSIKFVNTGEADQWPDAVSDGPSAGGVVRSGESWYATFGDVGTYRYTDRVFPNLSFVVEVL